MAKKYQKLSVIEATKKKVMILCMKEYIRLHPERKYDYISEDAIINFIADYYLKS